jgi:hypothetical protein
MAASSLNTYRVFGSYNGTSCAMAIIAPANDPLAAYNETKRKLGVKLGDELSEWEAHEYVDNKTTNMYDRFSLPSTIKFSDTLSPKLSLVEPLAYTKFPVALRL